MDETSNTTILFLILNAGALLAAFRAWSHSKEARALAEELVEDIGDSLRTHIVVAAAEAAQQVIEKLPKKRTTKAADPEAGDPAVTQ
jgi:hypothetical protein